jgi:hypothetical protein
VIGVSDVFVLLVSPDFFASDYVFDKELPAIIERSNQAGCPVVPVILTRCLWEAWLEGLLAVPNVPILEWKPVESGFDAANREVAKKIYNWCDIEPTPLLKKFFQGVA